MPPSNHRHIQTTAVALREIAGELVATSRALIADARASHHRAETLRQQSRNALALLAAPHVMGTPHPAVSR